MHNNLYDSKKRISLKKYSVYLLVCIYYSLNSMDQQLWIKVDDTSRCMDYKIAHRSNLLAALHTQYKGTETNPIIIPEKASITIAHLDAFSAYHKRNEKPSVKSCDYNSALEITDKMRDVVSYIQLFEQLDIPAEVKKRFVQPATYVALHSKLVKQLLTHTTIYNNQKRIFANETTSLKITHNGHHFVHNPHFDYGSFLHLWKTTKEPVEIAKIFSGYDVNYAIHFSPNGAYCIIMRKNETFIHDIATGKEHALTLPDYFDNIQKLRISPDSKHLMTYGIEGTNGLFRRFALWSLDENNNPHPIPLTSSYWEWFVADALFHPDNKNLICNFNAKKLSLCPIATPNEKDINNIEIECNKDYLYVRKLTQTGDDKYVLAKSSGRKHSPDMLFSLHEETQVPPIAMPNLLPNRAGCWIKNRYIPHKQLFTHIIDCGTTLQLLDSTMQLVAHHSTKNGAYICALAVESTGNYLASGYSNGTVIIWDLTTMDNRIIGTKITVPGGEVRSLTFGTNQLLLCQTGKTLWPDCSRKTEPLISTALLCDIHGDTIMDFGLTIASIMSKKGNRIVTISETLKPTNIELGWFDSFVTAKVWYLHNKKVQLKVEKKQKNLSKIFKNLSSTNS